MPQRIPKTFSLLGQEWRVGYKWALKCPDTGERLSGYCDPVLRIIWLDKLMTRDQKFSTFLHEFIHAALSETYITDSKLFHDGAEEIVCRVLEQELLSKFHIKWRRTV